MYYHLGRILVHVFSSLFGKLKPPAHALFGSSPTRCHGNAWRAAGVATSLNTNFTSSFLPPLPPEKISIDMEKRNEIYLPESILWSTDANLSFKKKKKEGSHFMQNCLLTNLIKKARERERQRQRQKQLRKHKYTYRNNTGKRLLVLLFWNLTCRAQSYIYTAAESAGHYIMHRSTFQQRALMVPWTRELDVMLS